MTDISRDAVVERNRQLLLQRSNVGIDKYGTTLADSGLSKKAILQHALEEALDLANYLQAEIMRIEAREKHWQDTMMCRICHVKPRAYGFDHCGSDGCIPF